jgi:pimeloyl-ACP methyl ester carboxylesterase
MPVAASFARGKHAMSSEPVETLTVSPGVQVAVHRIPREDGSDIIVYGLPGGVPRSSRPSIILLHGSGANSVFPQVAGHINFPLLFGALRAACDKWDVYFVEKRGIRFGECHAEGGVAGAGIEYLKGATYEGRVADVCCALDNLLVDGAQRRSPVAIIGSSEGSDIAVGVAARHRAPTHIALLPFSAGHGLYESLGALRDELAQGAITAGEFQEQYDGLVNTFRDVLGASRESIDKYLWGHTYRRWSSHCSGKVMTDLLGIDIPVFLGIPSLDTPTGADWVVAEFVKHGKVNLTYRNYLNCDHGFFEHAGGRVECRHSEVLTDILEWVRTSAKS